MERKRLQSQEKNRKAKSLVMNGRERDLREGWMRYPSAHFSELETPGCIVDRNTDQCVGWAMRVKKLAVRLSPAVR